MTLIDVFVPGVPKGQPRPRAFARGGKARVYDPGTAEHWKGAIAFALGMREPMDIPVALHLVFYMPRPKSHYRADGTRKGNAPTFQVGKPDADNLAKAVMDALTSVRVWRDDAQVVELVVVKWYDKGLGPGCQVYVRTAE